MSRIAPLAPEDFTPEQAELVGAWTHLNFSRVLVNSPRMYRNFVPHIEELIARSILPVRERQLVCLHILALCGETYERAHHVTISRNAGLGEAEIAAFCAGEGACLTDFDRVILQAVRELRRDQRVSDESWAALAAHYTQEQLMELVFLAGCYLTMAMLTRSFDIRLEAEADDLARINALRAYR